MTDDVRAFLAMCRHGTFLAAGEALGVATSTVSRRVGQLEARLGATLVERSTRGLTLTEAGRLYRDRVVAADEALSEAEAAVRALMGRPAGRLRVAAPSALIRAPIGPAALEYLRRYPQVALEIVGTDEDVDPDGETLHLAVRASRRRAPDHLVQRTLGRVDMTVCASPGWAAAHPIDAPEQLARHGCVVLGGGTHAAGIRMRRGDEERAVAVPIALFTTSISMARQAGLAGLGPVGLPTASCADLLATGALVELLCGWRLEPVPVVALSGPAVSFRARAFVDLLLEAFRPLQR